MIRLFIILILFVFTLFATTIEEVNEVYKDGDIKNAIKLYKELSRDGDDEAYFKLGTIYYKGKDVKRDINLAMGYFKQASAYGHIKAKYNSAIIYGLKQYKFHSYRKAYNIFLELAQNNYPNAQNKIGQYLVYRLGVDKDYKLAVKWFEQSYFVGHYKPASCSLALMYASGKGVFPNLGRARELAQDGYDKKIPSCVKVYKDFNLHKYDKDKGFKFGFYK
ncbi:MAG: tetratricopeptide repeat protein [Campylobacterota bacterium]|nr:tetratricopeptide repeat protein [Campylobacterota bacterium]